MFLLKIVNFLPLVKPEPPKIKVFIFLPFWVYLSVGDPPPPPKRSSALPKTALRGSLSAFGWYGKEKY